MIDNNMVHTIAALQMNSSSCVQQNLTKIDDAMQLATNAKAQCIILPENFACMPKTASELPVETFKDGPIQRFLQRSAKRYQMSIIAGAMPIKYAKEHKPYAQSQVYDTTGECVAIYNKRHLYDVTLENGEIYRESDSYQKGENKATVYAWQGIKVGLSICYDVRFPEMYREMSALGAKLMYVPAAFTQATGKAHWQTLLRARAVENQAFVVGVAQTGEHANNRRTFGHSMVIDPWGEIIAQAHTAPELLIAKLDMTLLTKIRDSFPVLQHRRDL